MIVRRLLPLLLVCAFVAACTAEPQPDPLPMSVPQWSATPLVSPTPSPSPSARPTSETLPLPYDRTAAVRSRLYTAPRAKVKCGIPVIRTSDWTSTKRYLRAVSSCLDRIWASAFKRTRTYFRPPERKFVRHRVKDPDCGLMPSKEADGTYCNETRTYYVLVERADLRPGGAARVAEVTAHEYGHHLQNMTNISDYMWEEQLATRSKGKKDLLSRRLELQAECFAGVALKTMGDYMPAWWEFRSWYFGTLPGKWTRDHGRLSTQLKWLERGYNSAEPGTCNTWTTPEQKVT
ncbi:neutral zinc metallopeptidase [Sphaerisporangium sp. NPDC088356]|uniref:neutral zinc metallopeptidase n=1 Tax=Sphaerisporangium sp. NPDC088356 TaxID=3154871 RepID=UPI00343E6FD7